jgi:acylphosphatase
MSQNKAARRWFVAGRVQGVGFRYFVVHHAQALGLKGYTQNLDDGRVEVYAAGTEEALRELAGRLHVGPRFAEVRAVEEIEASMLKYEGFHIRG